ncbi:hypothetical protein JD844_028620 [Phrynosoma platyrhinos]|uniref:C2 domain-containing protein n=1 Tax=Phrynosoma platyrhinos TaxID=52577 RepID=A0ABQ7SI54_PHRPL|nr:hypothetical protein JD844_028620 [Phrynosoma platyrhinos]
MESVDLGEIMYSLCYLPTAGRMTLTVIKCRNLKAMDITGSSGDHIPSHLSPHVLNMWRNIRISRQMLNPYVKVSLMCDGRRLKKRKTTIKKNTLNPVYNEAIVFDIPPENVDQVSLSIAVMDYDRKVLDMIDLWTYKGSSYLFIVYFSCQAEQPVLTVKDLVRHPNHHLRPRLNQRSK